MKSGSINVKSIITVVILLLVGVLGVLGINTVRTYMSSASSSFEPKNVSGLPGEDGKSAVISWVSDKPAAGVVEYGTTPASLLLRAVETDATTSHRVSISPLKSGTNYYFRIRVGEDIYDNNGIPFSFKTKAQEMQESQPTQIPIPTISTSGACNRTTDYNNDGKINTLDFMACNKGSVTVVPSPASSSSTKTTNCDNPGDYDGNGVVNSIDKVKCLQNKQQ